MKRIHAPNPRRAELKELSANVRPLVKTGIYPTVNAAILAIYSEQTGATEWKTFREWRELGRPVRKGEHGFPVWAAPRPLGKKQDQGTDNVAQDAEPADWFPVCYLFHAGQVEPVALAA